MILERITREAYGMANKNMMVLEGEWEVTPPSITLETLEKMIEQQREIFLSLHPGEEAEELKWDNFYEQLKQGKVAADMCCLYREKNDKPKCPKCGASCEPGSEAISRYDNFTAICSDCGVREAFGGR